MYQYFITVKMYHENMFEFDDYIYYDVEEDNPSSMKNAVNRYPDHLMKNR